MSTRGFITIATGKDKYYDLAYNLLYSYRRFATDNTPFAIICDRETWQAQAFDHVVLIEQPNCSYLDKLDLYRYSPYDETIFIDADSLVLSDPKGLWDDFADADDVSCYGCTYPLDSDRAWFTHDGCGKYKEAVHHLIDLHGGIYYFRKTSRAKSIFEKAIELAKNYHQYNFSSFSDPADEPVIALSLAIHNSIPCNKPIRVLFVPSYRIKLRADRYGKLYISGKEKKIEIIHFATVNTELFLYRLLWASINTTRVSPWQYLRIRIQTAPKNIRATIKHACGWVLRRVLDDATVDCIKKKIK